MKKFIIFILICFSSIIDIKGQERVDGENYSFSKSSEKIFSIMGWKYSDIEEKWYGNPNCLVEGIRNGSNEHFSHNLQSLQIKTFDYQNQTYYVLICKYKSWKYEYPALEMGIIRINKITTFLLNETQYQALFSNKEYQTFECVSLLTYSEQEFTENKFIRLLFSKNDFRMITVPRNFTVNKYKEVVRFNFNGDGPQMIAGSIKNEYYEISSSEWEKLKIK